ncbi:AmmeMemoRadiSam system protein B [Candidatus Woesebacteria bacterium RIFCSPHIGHO2_01_FULL_44_21]|uniref:AmmeMemoRadiSam system protein B n=1 Tax=Candidatus Woesebacteria bacterium RIFCSPHIGHO2_01_FULL_44_21 TaxID=1802503 RepID=A0A1F7YXA3_9BACT|nr:MAG: AmmeMemoRadiSam system protein B [Candidatus Woesebacteria bacterium RIFCSPHIGHO2_01_FULL_44_21]OGM69726.1 MAG: AmmeMemoRadiSam system protein B [Candidatus Woesebacteria bacterium RIFCSPLOWO2_01_FULL_44_24b]
MDKRITVAITSFLVIFALIGLKNPEKVQSLATSSSFRDNAYNREFIDQAYSVGERYVKKPNGMVLGGITPHHLLAAPLIAAFFEGLPKDNIKTVILVGPDHFNRGKTNITSSQNNWSTLYGSLNVDSQLVKVLSKKGLVSIENQYIFDQEHSIFGITTFIKRSLPNAQIVPLILKSTISKEECDRLAGAISQLMSPSSIIISSVDFSHYHPSGVADEFDKETIKVINSLDYESVWELRPNDNLDSPAAIYILLKTLSDENVKAELLQNTNSERFVKAKDLSEVTSYATYYFSLAL